MNSSSTSTRTSKRKRTVAPKQTALPPPKAKKPRVQTQTEKRLKRYRPSATSAVRVRIERALSQRLYLIAQTHTSDDEISREYKVLGQTGNVYDVVISRMPTCNCPDALRNSLCKHILFVMHRVLKVHRKSPLLYQQALLTSELHDIFAKADSLHSAIDSNVLAEQTVREMYQRTTGKEGLVLDQASTTATIPTSDNRKPLDSQDCPICFEQMSEDEQLTYCTAYCGNNIHQVCIDKWKEAKQRVKEDVTCPLCRAIWKDKYLTSTTAQTFSSKGQSGHGNYLNLAEFSTAHQDLTDAYTDNTYHQESRWGSYW
ncbi:unnamed protein product [Didymodactylos carnosus]|uniref:Uncharacterized protein n=1 Tax=Didymodactylos carnosus TaxID=1234261 RepID=A0A813VN75_9BILA|nr:unnamed protein product [Didymodactylos carnosus]CAF1307678.1 unnamed protein product [Didymodactylos carnosus]CAF3635943.1 unnamed protein product [Didymodactylos carnosus]CAF4114895.1 unnamed protein product [Didymodactylos carnosus]